MADDAVECTVEWTLHRLTELRTEYASGNAQLAELARRQYELRACVLRIEGAIQVLEEQIAHNPALAHRIEPAAPAG